MSRRAAAAHALPACFALTIPGLEKLAAQEIEQELGGEVKKTSTGLVVFRPLEISRDLLQLRTVEDIFLLLWGSDSLTYRAEDLAHITRWTAQRPDWPRVLQWHHGVRPKPAGRTTYHLVAQMQGEHGYRRVDALKAMVKGLVGKFPPTWVPVDENASVEVWLIIHGKMAVCGLRLSDRTMRHRTYKEEHRPASLRPIVAAAMVRLADPQKGQWLLDPMCGAGTILAERLTQDRFSRVVGGDLETGALFAAYGNLRRLGEAHLVRWDARRLPLADVSIHCAACNPPFGVQISRPEEIEELYADLGAELHRVVKPGGRIVLLAGEVKALDQAVKPWGWKRLERVRLRILGQVAWLSLWRRP